MVFQRPLGSTNLLRQGWEAAQYNLYQQPMGDLMKRDSVSQTRAPPIRKVGTSLRHRG